MARAVTGAVFAAMLMAAPAFADVTVTQTTGGKMFGPDISGTNVTRIKGHKMRVDTTRTGGPGNDTTMIFDVDAGKVIMLNNAKKEAIVRDTSEMSAAVTKIGDADMKASLEATAATKTIAGTTCTVYDSNIAVTFSIIEKQPPMTMVMTGPVCLSKTAAGAAEFREFFSAASQKGFIFTDPQAAKAQPGMAKGMATMWKKWADAGVALSSDINLSFEGEGMMAQMMKKMGGGKITSETTKIETAALSDDLFAVPAGYKTTQNK
jgi:hypothetical protein